MRRPNLWFKRARLQSHVLPKIDMSRSWRHARWAMVISLVVIVYLFHPAVDLIAPDSRSYLTFQANRTIGYPLLLWTVQKLFGSFEYLPLIQLGLFAYACGFLSQRLGLLGVVAIPLLMLQPYVVQSHFQLLTESLSLTLMVLTIGVWIDLVRHGRRADMLKLSLLVGVAILVRPSAYSLLAFLGFAVLRQRSFLQACAPIITLLFLGSLAQYINHGIWGTQSFLGHNLIGKVTFAMRDSANTPEAEKYKELHRSVKEIQEYVGRTTSLAAKTIFSVTYYDAVRNDVAPSVFHEDRDWNSVWTRIAIAVIRDNPVAYASDVLMNYVALWTYPQMMTHEQAAAFRRHVELTHPPTFPHYSFDFPVKSHPAMFLFLLRSLYGFSFALSLYFLIRFRRYPLEAGLSVMIHAHYLLIAGVQAGLARYAVIAWPCIVVMNLLFMERLVLRKAHGSIPHDRADSRV